ncbi:MAG: AAA family ATPase [bacterium]
MFRVFTIKNFRCFQNLTLTPLERVNLITGMNNVGKTALLEALFLHIGPNNPDLPMRIDVIRGIEKASIDAVEIWGWLFFGKRIDQTIEFTSLNDDNVSRSLLIRLLEPGLSRLLSSKNDDAESQKLVGSITTAVLPNEIMLEYKDTAGQTGTSRIFITPDGLKIERAQIKPFPIGIFLSARLRFSLENIERFSKLDAVGRQDEMLTILQFLEPRLRRLAVLVKGGVPMIYGDLGVGELVPLPLMGEGMVRLLSILLAIINATGGTVLIDEIENGLHHSVMLKVWHAIAEAARRSETQIFATTHSWECIRAAHEAFTKSGTYDFRLHRLDRLNDEIKAITYDQEALTAAIKAELEVR